MQNIPFVGQGSLLPKSMLTKCVYFKITPPQKKKLQDLGVRIFFGLKCRKFDSGTQVFCWTFFRHKHTYSNTPHPKKSICTHHRHKNRFQNFQKMAILAPKRCSNTAAKSVAFGRLFKRKKFFLKHAACLYTTISQCFDFNSSPGSACTIMEAPLQFQDDLENSSCVLKFAEIDPLRQHRLGQK